MNPDFTNTKVIIFDVDGTLTDDISWLNITSGLGADALEHKRIFEEMKSGILTYSQAKSLLIALWQETGNANKDFMESMFNSWSVKDDAADVINYLASKYHICLMSGAVDLYVQTIARRLGVV
jgi:phosphoserine phosphatase